MQSPDKWVRPQQEGAAIGEAPKGNDPTFSVSSALKELAEEYWMYSL
jgi:hypothetical protein